MNHSFIQEDFNQCNYKLKVDVLIQEIEEKPSEGIGEIVSQYAQKMVPGGESIQGGQAQRTD